MKNKVKPISIDEVQFKKNEEIPDEIIESFNKLIVKNWDGHSSVVKQDALLREINTDKYTRQQIFENNWLDIEPLFRKEGWRVFYDKPGYNENYTPFWKFQKK